jgi:hypothetical protein
VPDSFPEDINKHISSPVPAPLPSFVPPINIRDNQTTMHGTDPPKTR